MTYQHHLPMVFSYVARIHPDDVRTFVAELLDADREDVPQGSSFAVTVDNWDGTWNLWLSAASRGFLIDNPDPLVAHNAKLADIQQTYEPMGFGE
jgi:hypothetical protein